MTTAPTQEPTGTPTAMPSPTAQEPSPASIGHLFPSDLGKHLAAGTYATGMSFARPFTFRVPDGFELGTLREGNVAVDGPSGYLGIFAADGVFGDPCRVGDDATAASTADALVSGFRHMTGFKAGDITETTIDGRRARSFELSNAIDTGTAGCTRGTLLPLFTSLGNADGEATNGGTTELLWVLDGAPSTSIKPSYEGPIVIAGDGWDTDANRAVLERIARSVDFE
jgi:hypothetical protein